MSKKIILVSLIVIAAASLYFYFERKGGETESNFFVAERKNIVQEVSVTGRVIPSSNIELAFEKSGKIKAIYYETGSRIGEGAIIMEQENSETAAGLASARASLKAAEAKLSEIRSGARKEEIAVAQTKVANAEIALEDAAKNLADKISDAYTKSDDAIRNKADKLFSNPQSSNPQLNFSVSNITLKNNIESGRRAAEIMLVSWKISVDNLSLSGNLASFAAEAEANLEKIKNLLDNLAIAVNSLTSGAPFSQTTLDGWKSDISTARTNINAAVSNLSSANEKMRGASSSLALAKSELDLKNAGATPEEIIQQEAAVEKAHADVLAAASALEKTALRSPASGIISKIEARVGELVQASFVAAGLISDAKFKIEANVPEADIAKIKVGNEAKVTLDAYGSGTVFFAKIIAIEPAERIIDGVATYKTTFQFQENDNRIKSGMTANIDIITAKKDNIIAIPARSVYTRDGKKYVTVYIDKEKSEEKQIETGIQSQSGEIEIISGIEEGEKVIISR